MKSYRCVLISAVVYSVIIGAICVALATLAILARNNQFDMTGSPLMYMLYLLYFRLGEFKDAINWEHLGIVSNDNAIIGDETAATYRTFIFALVYVALHGLLLITSLYALCGIRNSCMGRKSFCTFFVPWIIVCCAILVMDVLATTYYIIDSFATVNTTGLMDLLEIQNPEVVGSSFELLSAELRILPPIIMFLATSKCFVFLIINIVVITLITRAGWAAANYHSYVDDTVRMYTSNMSRTNPGFENSQTDVAAHKEHTKQVEYMNDQTSLHDVPLRNAASAPLETPDRYNDTSVQAFVYPNRNAYGRDDRNQQEEPQRPPSQRPTSLALASILTDRSSQHEKQRAIEQQREDEREIENRLSHYSTSNGNVIRSVEPLKDENISERQQQQTRVRVLPAVGELSRNSSDARQKPTVPPKPYNPNRLSKQPSIVEERRPDSRNSAVKVDRNSSMNAPELRGQLPWSYFKARDDLPTKKVFTEVKEDEELPPVPIPDYTIHFPKAKRININDSDGDGSWSRYDQRY